MWSGGGFWGTQREEQWRRRKEKEYERQAQIRHEEQGVRSRQREGFEENLQAKDNVLKLTQNLLTVSRDREGGGATSVTTNGEAAPAAKRLRVDDDGPDSKPSRRGDPIQENLLCLSYAMYDSLFGESFNPTSFCNFLVQSGARSVAEEIGMAAIEKTYGDATTVRYVLEELVPNSVDSETLVQRVKETMTDDPHTPAAHERMDDEGKKVLLNWQVRHGSKEDAFQSALQITDEHTRVKTCLPLLEDKPARRQQLKQSSPTYCGNRFLGSVFADNEWPAFLGSIDLPKTNYAWDLTLETVLKYAVESMSPEAGSRVGLKAFELEVQSIGREVKSEVQLLGPSSLRHDDQMTKNIIETRKKGVTDMREFLSVIQSKVSKGNIQSYLEALSVDPWGVTAEFLAKVTTIPESACKTNHRDLVVSYKCSGCRESFAKSARTIGRLIGVREDPFTKIHPGFTAIGLDDDARIVLTKLGLYSAGAEAMLGDLSQQSIESLKKRKDVTS